MADFTNIFTVLQNAVTATNSIAAAIKNAFPQVTGGSTVVPAAGVLTFTSSQPTLFITVTTSSGYHGKVPVY